MARFCIIKKARTAQGLKPVCRKKQQSKLWSPYSARREGQTSDRCDQSFTIDVRNTPAKVLEVARPVNEVMKTTKKRTARQSNRCRNLDFAMYTALCFANHVFRTPREERILKVAHSKRMKSASSQYKWLLHLIILEKEVIRPPNLD